VKAAGRRRDGENEKSFARRRDTAERRDCDARPPGTGNPAGDHAKEVEPRGAQYFSQKMMQNGARKRLRIEFGEESGRAISSAEFAA